jgi:hypothetical protein
MNDIADIQLDKSDSPQCITERLKKLTARAATRREATIIVILITPHETEEGILRRMKRYNAKGIGDVRLYHEAPSTKFGDLLRRMINSLVRHVRLLVRNAVIYRFASWV